MNIFTGIMLVFALVGFADKVFSLRLGLCESFDKGLLTMGTMVVPIVGVCTTGVEFIERHQDIILGAASHMPFDATMIVGAILAPDMGGYFMADALTDSANLLVINGVVLGTLMGQAICFQMPVFMASVDKKYYPDMLKGFLVGITMIPVGMLVGEAILRMNFVLFLKQFVPILILCALVALGLCKVPDGMLKGLTVVGRVIQIATNIMFFIAMIGLFVPALRYVKVSAVEEALLIVLKSAIIIAGSLVMSELILKFFGKGLQALADRLGTNRASVVCMLMNCSTSLAILPLFDRMDSRGRQLNAAFSISGSYVIGGSMAFVSAVSSGYVVLIFLACKVVSGFLSMLLMYKIGNGEKPEKEEGNDQVNCNSPQGANGKSGGAGGIQAS